MGMEHLVNLDDGLGQVAQGRLLVAAEVVLVLEKLVAGGTQLNQCLIKMGMVGIAQVLVAQVAADGAGSFSPRRP